MSKQRRSFTPEFKQQAVDLCRRSGKSGCQVARELGLAQPTLNRWTRQAAAAPLGSNCFLATEELKVLRREVERDRSKFNHGYAIILDQQTRRTCMVTSRETPLGNH
jgi:transposase